MDLIDPKFVTTILQLLGYTVVSRFEFPLISLAVEWIIELLIYLVMMQKLPHQRENITTTIETHLDQGWAELISRQDTVNQFIIGCYFV